MSPQLNAETETTPEAEDDSSSQLSSTQTESVAVLQTKKRRAMDPRLDVWDHFTLFKSDNDERKARCKYCKKDFDVDPIKNGTSSMGKHVDRCKKKPARVDISQTKINLQSGESLGVWKFDLESIRKALAHMVIVDELAFKFVENEGFKYFMSVACPRFQIPSRWTVSCDVFQLYMDEKNLLKALFKSTNQRVCLTTDSWTSIQRLNYMCLTAHYIDVDWKLHKKKFNFCTISSHRGRDIGWQLEKCLHEWGIDRVFTITVDNAASNNTALDYLKEQMGDSEFSIQKCKHLHMRCVAHIINLVVDQGLKEIGVSVLRVRNAVRFVRQSPARLKRFKECAEQEKISTKSLLCLDVATPWNSTYLMLDATLKFEKAFSRFDLQEPHYRLELESGDIGGVPDKDDWLVAKRMLGFLKVFYDLTCRISRSLYVTYNTHFREIYMVHRVLRDWMRSANNDLVAMTKNMKTKFDKYWGNPEKMNSLIFIAPAFDPRYKLKWVSFALCDMYGTDLGTKMTNAVKEEIFSLYNEYKKPTEGKGIEQCSISMPNEVEVDDPTILASMEADSEYVQFLNGNEGGQSKTEVEKYFNEETEALGTKFDILEWWKLHGVRFPILSLVVRDVLAVPISTVASEATFSAGKRVLDPFRSSLTPKVVQSLICGQDWLRKTLTPINVEEILEEVDKLEQGLRGIALEASID